eukprot:917203-Rhodomonas_salina.1
MAAQVCLSYARDAMSGSAWCYQPMSTLCDARYCPTILCCLVLAFYAIPSTDLADCAISLRACYSVLGTDLASFREARH